MFPKRIASFDDSTSLTNFDTSGRSVWRPLAMGKQFCIAAFLTADGPDFGVSPEQAVDHHFDEIVQRPACPCRGRADRDTDRFSSDAAWKPYRTHQRRRAIAITVSAGVCGFELFARIAVRTPGSSELLDINEATVAELNLVVRRQHSSF
jgi:hypothetical protein